MLLYIFNLMIFDMSDCWSDKLIAIDSRSVCYLIKQLGQTTEDKSCDFQVKVDGVFDWRKVRTVMWSLGGVTLPCEYLVHVSNKQKYTHTQTHFHTDMHSCTFKCTRTDNRAHVYTHAHLQIHVHIHSYTHKHIHTHTKQHIYKHIAYTHTHTHTQMFNLLKCSENTHLMSFRLT